MVYKWVRNESTLKRKAERDAASVIHDQSSEGHTNEVILSKHKKSSKSKVKSINNIESSKDGGNKLSSIVPAIRLKRNKRKLHI